MVPIPEPGMVKHRLNKPDNKQIKVHANNQTNKMQHIASLNLLLECEGIRLSEHGVRKKKVSRIWDIKEQQAFVHETYREKVSWREIRTTRLQVAFRIFFRCHSFGFLNPARCTQRCLAYGYETNHKLLIHDLTKNKLYEYTAACSNKLAIIRRQGHFSSNSLVFWCLTSGSSKQQVLGIGSPYQDQIFVLGAFFQNVFSPKGWQEICPKWFKS